MLNKKIIYSFYTPSIYTYYFIQSCFNGDKGLYTEDSNLCTAEGFTAMEVNSAVEQCQWPFSEQCQKRG